jgi:alpha-beta hydrolase superfamily lysophospholipase
VFGFLFIPPVLLDEEGCGLWIGEMDFDPRAFFAQVRVPTLAFYGEADSWAPIPPSVEAWRAARGDEVEIVVIPDAEHELVLSRRHARPRVRAHARLWLKERSVDGG